MISTAATIRSIESGASFEMGCVLTGQGDVQGRRFWEILLPLYPLTQLVAIPPYPYTGGTWFSIAAGKPDQLARLMLNNQSVTRGIREQ